MYAASRTWLLTGIAALLVQLGVVGSVGAAETAWVTIKNDTNRVVIVQGTTTVNGQMRRGRPCRLLPGESVRQFHLPPSLTLEVFDGQNPNKLLHTGTLPIKAENQGFSVGPVGPAVVVTPVASR